MKKTTIVFCCLICIFLAGCASTARERLIAKCSQYESTGTIPAEVNNTDRFLDSLAGLFEGALAGLAGGWVILSINSGWTPAADTTFIAASVIGTVIGWYIADPGQSLKKGEYNEDEVKKDCDDFRTSEVTRLEALKYRDKLPVEYGFNNILWSFSGLSVGSAVGYFFGSLIGYGINNSGGTGNAFSSPGGQLGGIIGGSACGLAGASRYWSAGPVSMATPMAPSR